VHLNVPFEEPLYETVTTLSVEVKIDDNLAILKAYNCANLEEFASIWNNSSRKLFLAGVDNPNAVRQEIIQKIASDNSIIVLTETTSNLHHPTFINTIDTLISPFSNTDFHEFQPEILITFGGMIVSKRIKAFLRKYKPKHHWHIDPLRAYDTFGALTKHFQTDVNTFFESFFPLVKPLASDYFQKGQLLKAFRQKKHDAYLQQVSFSDFKAFEILIQSLPKNTQFQISNSSAIRYAQLIEIEPSIEVFCNRGTSGIDGSTSTAIGAAIANKKQTTFVTGDIGFLYDSNALWNNYIPKNFKIILINNGGGGIFRILPGHEETPIFNQFFETSHCLTAEHLAKMFGFKYAIASNETNLKLELENFFTENEKPSILEIFTPTLKNNKILLDYFNHLI
jgi:2-succinyl-5-enolpyruvyl-6-hydroxy-3-cyclohexene-1-carboxylate synthase